MYLHTACMNDNLEDERGHLGLCIHCYGIDSLWVTVDLIIKLSTTLTVSFFVLQLLLARRFR